ncbi:MAG: DUF4139 domain-containing protein [Planctomycetes bacterium]|nr:DUF4139 domain-containing protein [Planctomycetota bacterium]
MKNHLTEQELIEYQFKLASDIRMKETAEHLQGCGQCRGHLEKLQRKFATLDLLREGAKVSEDLISRVIEQTQSAQGGVRTRIVWFKKYAWLSSAAAVLVVGVLLVVTQLGKDGTKKREVAKRPMPTVEMELASKPEITSDASLDEDVVRKITLAMAPMEKGVDRYAAFDETAETAIPEEPPFAPASAIELVVLPRRDSVQLTIYNSTFQTLYMFGGYGGYGGALGGYVSYGGDGVKLDEATRKAIEEAMKRGQRHQIPSSVPGGDVTLVREKRSLTLKKGWNWLQFMWANTLIDPTSLSLEPLAQADKIDIQQLVFPARLRELGRWLIRSEVSGQVPFEITYFTSGLSWRAFYMGTLSQDEKTMQLQGYVRVGNNSGEDYEKAQIRLIVGKVHILDQIAELAKRRYPYNRPIGILMHGIGGGGGGIQHGRESERVDAYSDNDRLGLFEPHELRRKEIRKEGLSEYFLYTIEGTETIPDKWGKRLLSLDVEDIEIESLYKYDEQRWGEQTIRFVKFANDDDHNLGETPIPNGTVKIYSQADEEGYLSYVGGTSIKYIPVDEEVELNLGPARLVNVEPKLMDFKTENYRFDRRGNVAGWDEIRTWKIEITNTRELPIEIEITRGFDTAYWTIQTDAAYEKHDATRVRFKVNLEPRKKQAFEYTVTTYHGVREETLAEKN